MVSFLCWCSRFPGDDGDRGARDCCRCSLAQQPLLGTRKQQPVVNVDVTSLSFALQYIEIGLPGFGRRPDVVRHFRSYHAIRCATSTCRYRLHGYNRRDRLLTDCRCLNKCCDFEVMIRPRLFACRTTLNVLHVGCVCPCK